MERICGRSFRTAGGYSSAGYCVSANCAGDLYRFYFNVGFKMNQQQPQSASNFKQRHRRTVTWLALSVVAMFGFGYALVPLYYVLCDLTGFGGRANSEAIAATAVTGEVDTQRTITVEFIANVNTDAPWKFSPKVKKMEAYPGEFYEISYIAENLSDSALAGQAVPSIAPAESSLYFKKIECFCFNRQDFKPGESKDMPVVFRIDPKISKDIATITLSYTFFRVQDSDDS